jgi:hypothetical protein
MLASTPSQHLESDFEPSRNPKCESTSINHALAKRVTAKPAPSGVATCAMGVTREYDLGVIATATSATMLGSRITLLRNSSGPSHLPFRLRPP